VPTVAHGAGAGGPGAPADGARRQGVHEQVAQPAAVDLRPGAVALILLGEQDDAGGIDDAHRLTADVDERAELLVQAGDVQRRLAGVLVDVEHAALGAGVPARFEVEDGRLNAVGVEDPSGGEAAESPADDCYGVMRIHDVSPW
jgi:hypothetical protein